MDWPDKPGETDDDPPLTRDEVLRWKRAIQAIQTADAFEQKMREMPAEIRESVRKQAFPHLRNRVKIELRRRARERRAAALSTPPKATVH